MAFETVVKNLTELGVDPALVSQLVGNEKVATGLQSLVEGGLRQSDYDRKMNEGKARIAAAQTELEEFKNKLETDRQRMNGQFMTAQQEREAAESQLAAIRAKAKTLGQIYNIDAEKELFGDGTPPAGAPPARRTPEPEALPEDVRKRLEAVEGLVPSQVNLTTELMDIARQHHELFPDKSLNFGDLMKEAIAQRRSPTAVWDDKFGATAKRNELTAEKFRAEGRAAERAEWERKESERKVNPFGVAGAPTSPLFDSIKNPPASRGNIRDRNAGIAQSIANATAALESHKYAPARAGTER